MYEIRITQTSCIRWYNWFGPTLTSLSCCSMIRPECRGLNDSCDIVKGNHEDTSPSRRRLEAWHVYWVPHDPDGPTTCNHHNLIKLHLRHPQVDSVSVRCYLLVHFGGGNIKNKNFFLNTKGVFENFLDDNVNNLKLALKIRFTSSSKPYSNYTEARYTNFISTLWFILSQIHY